MNDQGGVYGRDLELVAEEDDNTGFENTQDIQSLLTQDLFAVLPVATLDFSGAELLVDADMPTFGWNINEEYALGDNLFGMRGYLCFTCAGQLLPWLAQETGSTSIGVLAYDVPQSSSCAEGIQNSFDTYPTAEVAFLDASLPYGIPDLSAQVRDMKEAGVDLVTTCMDFNGAITIQQEMRRRTSTPSSTCPTPTTTTSWRRTATSSRAPTSSPSSCPSRPRTRPRPSASTTSGSRRPGARRASSAWPVGSTPTCSSPACGRPGPTSASRA